MNQHLKLLLAPLCLVLIAGCSSRFGSDRNRGYSYQDQEHAYYGEPSPTPQQRTESQPQQDEPQQRISITGRVTEAGGLVSNEGTPYRLNGAKAAQLRDYTNQTVTVNGLSSRFEGERAIVVQSFRADQAPRVSQSDQDKAALQQQSRDTDQMQQNQNANAPDQNTGSFDTGNTMQPTNRNSE
jgi:hypothetical protein